jgi:hypothetical protein
VAYSNRMFTFAARKVLYELAEAERLTQRGTES